MINWKQEWRKTRGLFTKGYHTALGLKDSSMKILKRGIIIGGAVTRSLIGIGAAATVIYAAFRKKKGHGDKKDSIG